MRLNLSAGRVLRVLMVVILTLGAASLASRLVVIAVGAPRLEALHLEHVLALLDVDDDVSVPSWYSQLALFAAAALLAVIAAQRRAARDPFTRHWAFLAVVFVALSLDEAVGFHSLLSGPMAALLHTHGGPLAYGWVVPGLAFVAFVGVVLARFLFSLPRPTLRRFVVSGVLYVGGAIFVEAASGWVAYAPGDAPVLYTLLATFEELLEMTGVALFLHALLAHVAEQGIDLSVGVEVALPQPDPEGLGEETQRVA